MCYAPIYDRVRIFQEKKKKKVICKIQCDTNFENNNIKFYILVYKISCDKRIFETEFNITFKHKSYY